MESNPQLYLTKHTSNHTAPKQQLFKPRRCIAAFQALLSLTKSITRMQSDSSIFMYSFLIPSDRPLVYLFHLFQSLDFLQNLPFLSCSINSFLQGAGSNVCATWDHGLTCHPKEGALQDSLYSHKQITDLRKTKFRKQCNNLRNGIRRVGPTQNRFSSSWLRLAK